MRWLGALLLSLWACAAQAAFSHIQGNAAGFTVNGSNQCKLTLGSAIGAGHVVVAAVRTLPNGVTISSISDGTNTYTQLDSITDAGGSEQQFSFIAGNVSATGASPTITVTFSSGSGNPCDMVADEYSGALAVSNPTDVHNVQTNTSPGTGANAIQSPSVTTTVAGDLIWGASFSTSNTPAPAAGTSPFTFTAESSATTTGVGSVASEDATQGSAGATHTAFTDSTNGGSNNYVTFVVAIKPAATAACPPPSLALLGVGC